MGSARDLDFLIKESIMRIAHISEMLLRRRKQIRTHGIEECHTIGVALAEFLPSIDVFLFPLQPGHPWIKPGHPSSNARESQA
jgi:hypothetical protein